MDGWLVGRVDGWMGDKLIGANQGPTNGSFLSGPLSSEGDNHPDFGSCLTTVLWL